MPTSLQSMVLDRLERLLPDHNMKTMAHETKFMVRSARKVPPAAYLNAFCANAAQTISLSMSHYAAQLSLMTKTVISKQAVAAKIKAPFVSFLKKTSSISCTTVSPRPTHFPLRSGAISPVF